MKNQGKIAFVIRVPEDMHWKFKEACAKRKTSMQRLLEQYIQSVVLYEAHFKS